MTKGRRQKQTQARAVSTRLPEAMWLSAGGTPEQRTTLNSMIDDLSRMKRPWIQVEGHLAASKVAWKFAVLRMSLIYRLLDIAEATVREWCGDNGLSSVVLARAFLETVALAHWFTERADSFLKVADLDGLNSLVMKTSFGIRNSEYLKADEHQATNVLTMINSLEKVIEGALGHYERLSDVAHPNAFGQHQFYSRTDYNTGVVRFAPKGRKDMLPTVAASLFTGVWAVRQLERLELAVGAIAGLQVAQQQR